MIEEILASDVDDTYESPRDDALLNEDIPPPSTPQGSSREATPSTPLSRSAIHRVREMRHASNQSAADIEFQRMLEKLELPQSPISPNLSRRQNSNSNLLPSLSDGLADHRGRQNVSDRNSAREKRIMQE